MEVEGSDIFFRNLGISTGYSFDQFISMSTKKRRLCSIRDSLHATKNRRIGKKLFAAGIADTQQQKEGTIYASVIIILEYNCLCRCCMFVSCVHPVAVLNAAFCMTCSLLMLVEEVS